MRALELLLTVASLGLTPAAGAVTFQFEGVVTSVIDAYGLVGSVTAGTPFSGAISFDPGVPDGDPSTYVGRYLQAVPPAEFYVNVGDYSFRAGSAFGLSVYNDWSPYWSRPEPGNDELFVASNRNNLSTGFPPGWPESNWFAMQWLLQSHLDPLSGDALPTAPPTLSEWSLNYFNITRNDTLLPYITFQIQGTVTRIVPETGTGSLLGLTVAGLLGLEAQRRARRSKSATSR